MIIEKTEKYAAQLCLKTLLFLFFFIGVKIFSQSHYKRPIGEYIGQHPPGNNPEIFAEGFISLPEKHEFSCSFSPDGKEFYFNRGKNIMLTKLEENGWTEPEILNLGREYFNKEPFVTSDNQYLFFGSDRINESGITLKGVWFSKREGIKWSEPSFLYEGNYISISNKGNIYLTDNRGPRETWCIVRAKFSENNITEITKLNGGAAKPSSQHTSIMHPCISIDESFLIFCAHRNGEWGRSCDLFVVFKDSNNEWSEAHILDDNINKGFVMAPSLSYDGKYLFYYYDHDIYWVSINAVLKFYQE